MRWEITKVVLVYAALALPPLHVLQRTVGIASTPGTAYYWLITTAAAGWSIFLYWNMVDVFRRLSRRQRAYLRANGMDFSLQEVIGDPKAWRIGREARTTRDFIMKYRDSLNDREIRS